MAGPRTAGTRRPGPIPCRDQHGWERPLGSPARSTQGGGPCRRSGGGPTNGGVRAGAGDHHADALRFFLGQLAPSAGRSRQPDASVAEVPGLRVRPPDRPWRALQRHRAPGPDPGFPQAQHRARRGAHAAKGPLSTSGLRSTIRPARRCWRRPAVSPGGYLRPARPSSNPVEAIHAPSGTRDVDLLIRTGGEQRLSDFLLWESAYAELYFTDVLWPDFNEADLAAAVQAFAARDRRYGGVLKAAS